MADELETLYLTASAALERGDFECAREAFERLAREVSSFAPVWDGLGRCLDAEGDLEGAGDCFRRAMRLDRRAWRSRYHWGAALQRSGHLEEAIRWAREATRLAPAERLSLRLLGLCQFDLGEYRRALESFRKALAQPENDVTDADLYVLIGRAEAESGDLEAAEASFERACLISPDHPDVYHHWALLSARHGDLEGAERLAKRAHALDHGSPQALRLLFDLALQAARWEAAVGLARELSGRPDQERLGLALEADVAGRTGDRATAAGLALRVLQKTTGASDEAVSLALAILRAGNGEPVPCTGFRVVLEVTEGTCCYFRPFVVLAPEEDSAVAYATRLQQCLESRPCRVTELERFPHDEAAAPGVYDVLLTRVLFETPEE